MNKYDAIHAQPPSLLEEDERRAQTSVSTATYKRGTSQERREMEQERPNLVF